MKKIILGTLTALTVMVSQPEGMQAERINPFFEPSTAPHAAIPFDKIQIQDYEEAIFNFKNKKYKSCAMILLSLIDAKLIRMQRKEDRNKGRRSTGFSAIKNIEKRIDAEENIEKKLLLFLLYKNLFACLKEIFANGDDFKTQPILANRNFVYHGMLHRNVCKRDCIQLFLLYYNFLMFFEMIVD